MINALWPSVTLLNAILLNVVAPTSLFLLLPFILFRSEPKDDLTLNFFHLNFQNPLKRFGLVS
jgi:hypothetical protein